MRLRFDWKFSTGCLAMFVTLALSSPGVRVVRAEEDAHTVQIQPVAEGPSCRLADPEMERGRLELVLDSDEPGEAGSPTIALNNRGYGYQPDAVGPEGAE